MRVGNTIGNQKEDSKYEIAIGHHQGLTTSIEFRFDKAHGVGARCNAYPAEPTGSKMSIVSPWSPACDITTEQPMGSWELISMSLGEVPYNGYSNCPVQFLVLSCTP